MSQALQNYQPSDSTSTEGLDQFFATASQCESDATQCEAGATQCESDATHTILEASQILKVSPSTIYRRIKAGKYATFTELDGTLKVIMPRTASQFFADATTCEAVATQCESDATQCEAVATADNELAKALLDMAHQLQHATYRNGWLESKLEELQKDIEQRDQAIKLLTDSQHKTTWWHRFKSWCAR